MSNDLNKCMFIGRLGKDPEIKYTQDGVAIANFSIAVGESYKNKNGEKVDKTEWINLVAWRKLAEICGEYLKKGSKVYICGKYETQKWQDKEGNDRYTTKVTVSDMQTLDGKPATNQEPRPSQSSQPAPQSVPDFDDELTF